MTRISRGEANRRLAHAAAVSEVQTLSGPALPPQLPATAEAVRAGAISAEHVEAVRRVMTALPPHVDAGERESAEHTLVQAARSLDPGTVNAVGRTLLAVLDQDGQPPNEAELRNPINELRWHTRANGEVELKGRLGIEGGALLVTVLSPPAKPRPRLPRPEPNAPPQPHPPPTPPQWRRPITRFSKMRSIRTRDPRSHGLYANLGLCRAWLRRVHADHWPQTASGVALLGGGLGVSSAMSAPAACRHIR